MSDSTSSCHHGGPPPALQLTKTRRKLLQSFLADIQRGQQHQMITVTKFISSYNRQHMDADMHRLVLEVATELQLQKAPWKHIQALVHLSMMIDNGLKDVSTLLQMNMKMTKINTARDTIFYLARTIPCECLEQERRRAKDLPATRACNMCRKEGTKNEMMRCARCKQVRYCSKKCQLAHWPIHKRGCSIMASMSK